MEQVETIDDSTEFYVWYQNGVKRGWIGPMTCLSHDGVGLSEPEMDAMMEGDEVCVWVMRRYESEEQKEAVEWGHAPSVWRKP